MADRTLSSWKEIAHHFGVNVRTAQRWERERHLPVQRLPGGSGRVTTTATALDKWRQTAKNDTTKSRADAVCYRIPLAKNVMAELRITGAPITTEHLDRLRQYLDLVQEAVRG
jgi:hypothetical protein